MFIYLIVRAGRIFIIKILLRCLVASLFSRWQIGVELTKTSGGAATVAIDDLQIFSGTVKHIMVAIIDLQIFSGTVKHITVAIDDLHIFSGTVQHIMVAIDGLIVYGI